MTREGVVQASDTAISQRVVLSEELPAMATSAADTDVKQDDSKTTARKQNMRGSLQTKETNDLLSIGQSFVHK